MPNSPAVSFEVVGDISILPAAVEVAAYRIAQEAISNATKHACAQRITVRVSRTDNGLTVEIDDDGIGVVADTNPSGMGLVSMTERATELGGWCTNRTFTNRRHGDQGVAADLDRRLGRKHMTHEPASAVAERYDSRDR